MQSRTLVWALWLTLCGAGIVHAGNPPQNEYVVPIKLYGGHLIVLRGGLGNLRDRNLVLDTGSYPSVIDEDTARKLKLEIRRQEMHVLEHNVPAGTAIIPRVEVGPLQLPNLRVMVEDLSGLSKDFGVRVDALIGLDVFSHMNFEVDYVARELVFGAPVQLGLSVPLEPNPSMACVEMHVNGHRLQLLVDTGAAKTVLFAQRVPWLDLRQGRTREFNNMAGKITVQEIDASEVELGTWKVVAKGVLVSNAANMASYPFDGMLATWGTHVRRIAFDFLHGVFSWEADDIPAAPVRDGNTGLSATARRPATSGIPNAPTGGIAADSQQEGVTGRGLGIQ